MRQNGSLAVLDSSSAVGATTSLQASPSRQRKHHHGYQAYLSALQDQARPHSRLPRSQPHEGRPSRSGPSSRQGPSRSRPLIAVASHGWMLAVTGSPAENYGFPRSSRLIKSADFGVILRTRNAQSFRVHSAYFSAGCLENSEPLRVRIGITVGKRNAPLSVDRAIVKRALREAARLRLPEIRKILAGGSSGLDVSLRLKAELRSLGASSRSSLKKMLRADAVALLEEVVRRVDRRRKAQSSQEGRGSI